MTPCSSEGNREHTSAVDGPLSTEQEWTKRRVTLKATLSLKPTLSLCHWEVEVDWAEVPGSRFLYCHLVASNISALSRSLV